MNDPLKHLSVPLVVFAVVLGLTPLLELAGAIWPIRPGSAEWRFGTIGLLSKTLVQPILGCVIIVLFASFAGWGRVQVAMSWLFSVAATLLMVALPLFVLDTVELRSRVPAEAMFQFDVAAFKAVIIHASVLVALIGLSVGGFKSSKRLARRLKE